jgi:hypothetical protein
MKTSLFVWPRRVAAILAANLILVLSACVGGGSIGPIAEGGIGGTGISFGPVTGFGSVLVNGTAFDTNDAVILVDGEPATEASLTEGMLVRVEGEWTGTGTGTADRIEYRDDIRGPVQTVVNFDPLTGSGTLTVLGQTVHFNRQTVFRGATREAIAVGDDVAVSGWYLDSGEFLASLVRRAGTFVPGGEAEVKGIIEALDTVARSFRIGGLAIVYGPSTEIEMKDDRDELLPNDNGVFVEVEGTFDGSVLLLADEIEQEDDRNLLRASGGDDVEIEGPISSVDPGSRTFILNGTIVQVTNGTEFDDGLRESDLQPGLQVSVEGEWDARGFLVADEIESRSADSEVNARILDVLNSNELDVGGVSVRVTSRTLIVDEDDDDRRLLFGDLQVPETVEVDGIRREDTDGSVYLEAIKIEREDDDDDDQFQLSGRVDAVDPPNRFRALGVWMNVNQETEWDEDDGLEGIDDLSAGDRLEVEYELRNGQFFAIEVEREDD